VTVLSWFLAIAGSALVAAEVIEWCGPAQRALVRRAAARLPIEYRDRYIEEWKAELAESPGGPLTRFLFTVTLLVRSRRLESALRDRTRDLADMLLELQTRRLKAVIFRRMIVAEAPNGERYAWRWEGRVLTRVPVPDEDLGLEHLRPLDIKYLSFRMATDAANIRRAPISAAVGEASLPAVPIYETGS
jgi:hypothetical protein